MLEPLWSLSLGSAVRALQFAREAELLLARDDSGTLTLINVGGETQAAAKLPGTVAASISDDGSTIAAVGDGGQVWWLAPDLAIRSERSIAAPAVSVALNAFGQYLAVSDNQGNLHLLDRTGKLIAQFTTPRPVHHLAFVPMQPHLTAAADLGWAGCLDLATGQWLWSDRPVSNIGALAVTGSGDPVLLACFSMGVRRYGPTGYRTSLILPKACSLLALSFDSEKGIAGGAGHELYAFNATGELTITHELQHTPMALAMSALGDRVYCGFADGTIAAFSAI